jgi:superfamily II DNA/RNA helicase
MTPSPFNPNSLEVIATAFALDVPSIALLVLPASSPVQRAVYELREMGINAQGLDLLQGKKGKEYLLRKASMFQENPTLLVSTLATTRGVDLAELSHVFILGMPEGPKVTARAVDAYLHVAGRVGRFGRGGRVITLVEKAGVDVGAAAEGGSEAGKMSRILKTIEVTPVRFGGFD